MIKIHSNRTQEVNNPIFVVNSGKPIAPTVVIRFHHKKNTGKVKQCFQTVQNVINSLAACLDLPVWLLCLHGRKDKLWSSAHAFY